MTIQELKTAITANFTTFFASKPVAVRDQAKKAMRGHLGSFMASNQTWEDVTPALVTDKLVTWFVNLIQDYDKKNTPVSYTDLDTDA